MAPRGSGLTAPQLERMLGNVRDDLARTKRELLAARTGSVQVPLVTPGQLAEVRHVAELLKNYADVAQSLADSVTNWANQLERFTPTTGHAPEVTPTT